jgi:outer membrane PBP1 activator LpoA protein
MPSKNDILDLYFMDSRCKLIDIAAYLDRVDRHDGDTDFRHDAFLKAIEAMLDPGDKPRAQAVLESLSDHSTEPAQKATIQGAFGAPNQVSGAGSQASGTS